jgi:hypothetical protein
MIAFVFVAVSGAFLGAVGFALGMICSGVDASGYLLFAGIIVGSPLGFAVAVACWSLMERIQNRGARCAWAIGASFVAVTLGTFVYGAAKSWPKQWEHHQSTTGKP